MSSVRAERAFRPGAQWALESLVERGTEIRCVALAATPRPWRVLPDVAPHIIAHRYTDGTTRAHLVGPRSVYKDVDQRGRSRTLIIRLRPAPASMLLPVPLVELADRAVEVGDVWSRLDDALLEALDAPHGTADPLAPAWRVLADALRRAARPPETLADAVRRVERAVSSGRCRVDEMAREVGVSGRYLRRLFKQHTGLSPKHFARVWRVHTLVRASLSGCPLSWAARAAAHGYFDQSHLIEDCRALLGETPEAFRRRCAVE